MPPLFGHIPDNFCGDYEYLFSFDTPAHDMMQNPGGI
jgi:hypothetical protein